MDDKSKKHKPLTFKYKSVASTDIYFDIYPPALSSSASLREGVPAVVYFHGGGLTVGSRTSWFPYWLEGRVTSAGIAFISADYRLIPPSSGRDVVEDVKDLFNYLATNFNKYLCERLDQHPAIIKFTVDANNIAVAGTSAGGLCAYLAAIHANPKPRALVAMYAMGGNFLIPHYLTPKTEVFFRGRELLDPANFQEYLPPKCHELPDISDSPLAYNPLTASIPGYPANPRMLLARLYLQMGSFLDFYTDHHGLSVDLRSSILNDDATPRSSAQSSTSDLNKDLEDARDAKAHLPPDALDLFPQFNVTPQWPPSLLVHGNNDTAVRVQESRNMHHLLFQAGVPVTLKVVPGQEHSFDYAADANTSFGGPGGLFDEVAAFITSHLLPRSAVNA